MFSPESLRQDLISNPHLSGQIRLTTRSATLTRGTELSMSGRMTSIILPLRSEFVPGKQM
jgi:hypothetical protein